MFSYISILTTATPSDAIFKQTQWPMTSSSISSKSCALTKNSLIELFMGKFRKCFTQAHKTVSFNDARKFGLRSRNCTFG